MGEPNKVKVKDHPSELRSSNGNLPSEHTRGPWKHGDGAAYNARRVFVREGYDDFISVADTEANARRIVACVNACEGIPTKLLEETGAKASEVVQEIQNERDQLRERVAELERVVERLLRHVSCEPEGVLSHMNELAGRLAWYEGLGPIKEEARALLANERP